MARNPPYADVQPVELSIISNTASAASALLRPLRTVDATTNFITEAAGADTVTLTCKTVNAAGAAIQAQVDWSVSASAGNATTMTAASGTILTPTPNAIIAVTAGMSATFTRYTASFLTDATTGILTATITFSGNATITSIVRCGQVQILASSVI